MARITIKNKNEYNFNDIFSLIFKKNKEKNIATYGIVTHDISSDNHHENDVSMITFDDFRDLVEYMEDIIRNIVIDEIIFANSYDELLVDDIFLQCRYSQTYTTFYKIVGISENEYDVLVNLKKNRE